MSAPHQTMAGMISGYWISQSVHVAAKLGLADALANGPKDIDSLAAEVQAHPATLYRLMRALASVGVFSETSERQFRLTPLADCLRKDAPDSQWAMALMMGDEHYNSWGGLLESVRTGVTSFDRIYGMPIFEYLAQNPDQAAIFDAAMTSIHGRETRSTLDAYSFDGISTLADVGGGNASNLIGILQAYPNLKGLLFDLPHVVERARANVESAGLAGRFQIVGGDFFQEVSAGADAYFLRHIIHDWDDERASLILRNIRKVIPDSGRLLLVEYVLPPGDAPSFGKLLDLNMLVIPGGVERTEKEFASLYQSCGFRLSRVVPTEGDLSVIEGMPV